MALREPGGAPMIDGVDAGSLLRRKPFERFDPLTAAEPLGHDGGHSGSAFWATGVSGRRYKLRVCRTAFRARNLARYLEVLGERAPKLLARDGSLLLLEVLDGYESMERLEVLEEARTLGRWAATLHRDAAAHGIPSGAARFTIEQATRLAFRRDLERLQRARLLTRVQVRSLRDKLERRIETHGFEVSLEMDDLHKGNFMRRPGDGTLRYVDEQGLALRPRGMGLATLLKTATRSRSWLQYCEGYGEVAPSPFLDPERVEVLLLIDAVRRAARKHHHRQRLEKLPETLDALHALAGTPGVALRWCFPRGY